MVLTDVTKYVPRGSLFAIARVVVVSAIMLMIVLFIAEAITTPPDPTQSEFASAPQVRANLEAAGLSPTAYVWIGAITRMIGAVTSILVALLIVWRRPRDWMGLYVPFVLVMVAASPSNTWTATLPLPLVFVTSVLRLLGFVAVVPFFYLFPDGRFVPRWTRWLALYWAITQLTFTQLPPPSGPPTFGFLSWWMGTLFVCLSMCIIAPIYRYLRVATPMQRQQTKWLIFGVASGIVPAIVWFILNLIFPSFAANGTLSYVVGQTVISLALFVAIPLSIGIALLRYRLWDVDPLINRALVYGSITIILVLLYIGSVILIQQIVRFVTGASSQLAVVASTLLIATLFQPLRNRLQRTIDRRFYRRKYDATRTLTSFSNRLRNEVDLATLSDELLSTVEDTLQPSHVSLWLR